VKTAVDSSLAAMATACAAEGAIEVNTASDTAESDALLAARRCSLPALSRLGALTILEDASVPRPRLAEMVGRIDAIAARHQVTIATFGHAGDGNLHPTCVLPDPRDEAAIGRAEAAFDEIFSAALDLGGTITGEHGVGAAKLPHLAACIGDSQMALLRRIKTAFDPAGILNPGKLGS
jgi:glycolate oxidase